MSSKELPVISGYQAVTPFSTAGAGTSQWCFVEKDHKRYFFKQFLSPVLPAENGNYSESFLKAQTNICIKFRDYLWYLYRAVHEADCGILVCPTNIVPYNSHFCAISEALESTMKAEDIYTLQETERLILMRTFLYGLEKLGRHHVVHGDIKNSNLVVVMENGFYQLRIIDFDSGFLEKEAPTDSEKYKGDLVYFAPEAVRFIDGEDDIRLTCAIDRFAAGLVIHQMWCGRLPSFPQEYGSAALSLLNDVPLTIDPSCPPQLKEAIIGLTNPDPLRRMSCHAAWALLEKPLKDRLNRSW